MRLRLPHLLFVAALSTGALPSPVRADEPATAPALEPPASAETPAPEVDYAFPVGEELIYRIKWGFLPVGEARATTEWIEEDGRRLLRIRFRIRTNKVLSSIYPVDDLIESIAEPDGLRPLRFIKKQNEGSNHYDQETTFDWDAMTAHWVSRLDHREHTFPIQPDTRDLPTFMYRLRGMSLEPDRTYHMEVMADEKTYALDLHTQDIEKVRLPNYRRVRSLKMEPRASFNGLFVRKGRMWAWISRDSRRLLTQAVAQVPVASVRIILLSVKGPGDDSWITRNRNKEKPDKSLGLDREAQTP